MPTSATSTDKTLRKFGANLRWLIEKSGINPEATVVTIGVKDVAAKGRLLSTIAREFDRECMTTSVTMGDAVIIFGVPVFVMDNSRIKN